MTSIMPPAPVFPSQTAAQETQETTLRQRLEEEARQTTDTSSPELREKFNEFVGQTFFGTLVKAMRKTVDKPAYFHGGRGEEVFQAELDRVFVEELTESTASQIAEPMFELFNLNMQRRS